MHPHETVNSQDKDTHKLQRSKFVDQLQTLVWKSYIQRQRRWRIILIELLFALLLIVAVVIIAKPVFLTPLQAQPVEPLTVKSIKAAFDHDTIVGYVPVSYPYDKIMADVSKFLGYKGRFLSANNVEHLNHMLYTQSEGKFVVNDVIWIVFKNKTHKTYNIELKSTMMGKLHMAPPEKRSNAHLRAGFLALQLAISNAIIQHEGTSVEDIELNLVAMPVSPLMVDEKVRRSISMILMCLTLALLPPVMETELLVVSETTSRFKRALRIQGVQYSVIYLHWMIYGILTAVPICIICAVTLILIFRWVHLLYVLLALHIYVCLMTMQGLIMSMFHSTPWTSCVWSTLFTLLQTFLAELMVHHNYMYGNVLDLVFHMCIPPLGLLNGLNQFALLQTGASEDRPLTESVMFTIASWLLLIFIYFEILMLLQWTLSGQERAIGGQISWKAVLFKKVEDKKKLNPIETPSGKEREHLQEVDEFVAKAISFRNVTKQIMHQTLLQKVTFDVYRGEYTNLFCERVQDRMMSTVEDLLCGLTQPDSGTINILGSNASPDRNFMVEPYMVGYCDRASCLIDDLTVEEHLILAIHIRIWHESREFIAEYTHLRFQKLLQECNLDTVLNVKVWQLDHYYRAQLCWALAMLREPKIIIIPNFTDTPLFMSVIRDKIVTYRKHITIVKVSYTSVHLEHADRAFIFDKGKLCFGGTPAYMFFKYGREYRFRLSLHGTSNPEKNTLNVLDRALAAGATVRAHLGTLLILRMPATPTEKVAQLVKDLYHMKKEYGIASMNVSVADTEEVFGRILYESRSKHMKESAAVSSQRLVQPSLQRIADQKWGDEEMIGRSCNLNMRLIGWKFFTFYVHYRLFFIITIIVTIVTGLFIGVSMAELLRLLEVDIKSAKQLHGDGEAYVLQWICRMMLIYLKKTTKRFADTFIVRTTKVWNSLTANVFPDRYNLDVFKTLTMDALDAETTLVLRVDAVTESRYLAEGYVMSYPNANIKAVNKMEYIALEGSENLMEYLMTCAIDSPQIYVKKFAYGMDVKKKDDRFKIDALYSALHWDRSTMARSMARVMTSLLRFYSNAPDAAIRIVDDPLIMDATEMLHGASVPPLLIQFLLVLTIAHMTLIPSKEHGLVRHTQVVLICLLFYSIQAHAKNFSPAHYWLTLFFYDVILYWILVALMTGSMIIIMTTVVNHEFFVYKDVWAIPLLLCIYGVGSIPVAYLFALGKRPALNSMAMIIFNVVFGETTILAKWFYGDIYTYALNIMSLFPQYNMVIAFIKVRRLFLYNIECSIFAAKQLCESKILHKCCEKCGVLQKCFKRKSYWKALQPEILAILCTATFLMVVLFLWEYRIIQRLWHQFTKKKIEDEEDHDTEGAQREKNDVLSKETQLYRDKKLKSAHSVAFKTFGEYLLAVNVGKKLSQNNMLEHVYLGVGKSEALALSGLKRHGRLMLCDMMAGYRVPDHGRIWAMSKYRLQKSPHKYAQNTSFCCERDPLPKWMSVYDGLRMIGLLRGVHPKSIHAMIRNYTQALDLDLLEGMAICRLHPTEKTRLNFAAAVIGAPPVIVLDECTAYQRFRIRRAMYFILYDLRKKGHAIFISSSNVENHMPVATRLAILVDVEIRDVDRVSNLLERYSEKGYTVVVHLKDDVDINAIFTKYFTEYVVNDTTDELVNVQILDDLSWAKIFEKMEQLKKENTQVYSYIVTAITIDYIYNNMLSKERGFQRTRQSFWKQFVKKLFKSADTVVAPREQIHELNHFERSYNITSLAKLPWSVIFHR